MANKETKDNPNKKRKIYKIKVARDACISIATCVTNAPGAFEMDREDIAIVKDSFMNVSDDDLLIAAQSCPTAAIALFDENDNQIFP